MVCSLRLLFRRYNRKYKVVKSTIWGFVVKKRFMLFFYCTIYVQNYYKRDDGILWRNSGSWPIYSRNYAEAKSIAKVFNNNKGSIITGFLYDTRKGQHKFLRVLTSKDNQWLKTLKKRGKLFIAEPDEGLDCD